MDLEILLTWDPGVPDDTRPAQVKVEVVNPLACFDTPYQGKIERDSNHRSKL